MRARPQIRALTPLALCVLASIATTPAKPQTAPQPDDAIHATVTEVALDLEIRDKKGRLVKNLKPGDVEIYEDGVRQEIRSFRLVSGQVPAPTSGPAANEVPAGIAAAPLSVPLRATNLVCIVFHNLDPSTKKWAVDAAQQFIRGSLTPGTWVGIFNLDSQLRPLHAFTTDRNELLRAAAEAFTRSSVDIARAADAVLNSTPNLQVYVGFVAPGGKSGGVTDLSTTGSVNLATINGADVGTDAGANNVRGDLVSQRRQFLGIEGARQMDQIDTLIRQLGAFPGHKTVLLLSPGLTTTGDPDRFQATLNHANQSGVSVYAFDANGLSQISSAQASTTAMQHVAALSQQQGQPAPGETKAANAAVSSMGSAGAVAERIRQDEYTRNAVRASDPQAGLRALAEGTGGFLVANTNDLRKPFQRIVEELQTHYEADYHPSSAVYDGHFRKIEVKLARADLTAQNRGGYFAMPDIRGSGSLTPVEIAGLTVLNTHPLPQAFAFHAQAFHFRPGGTSQCAVAFELPAAGLTATPQPERKTHRLHAALLAIVRDNSGQVVDKFSQDTPYEIPDDKLAVIQAAPITYTHVFDLEPGHYVLESALLDRESNRSSTAGIEFDSPPRGGVGLSSLMLVERADPLTGPADTADPFQFHGKELAPMLDRSLTASAHPLVYFVVYPDTSYQENAKIEVEYLVDGESLAKKEAELPPPDELGAIPMLVNAVAKPGHCELRIRAMQASRSTIQTLSYVVSDH